MTISIIIFGYHVSDTGGVGGGAMLLGRTLNSNSVAVLATKMLCGSLHESDVITFT